MSLRSFTVFQDAVSGDPPQPKISRPVTRSATLAASGNATVLSDLTALDKENYHPVTGQRAGPSNAGAKKRKTTALAASKIPLPTLKLKKDKDTSAEPDQKKRKASLALKTKARKDVKPSGSKKGAPKRAGSRKVSPMPKLNEEEEAEKDSIPQADIDSRCYELTVKPLADVSEAYEEVPISNDLITTADASPVDKVKFRTVKSASVEPEIRDYFQPTQAQFRSSTSRFRALSEDVPEPRAFSTPERKQIYAAFTFSSPCASSARMSKVSRSASISSVELNC